MINITYKNKQGDSRRIIHPTNTPDDILWFEIKKLILDWCSNIYIFNE
jgi:hypothetical protein